MEITEIQREAFWSKVDVQSPSECWVWNGAKKPKGYGNVRINGGYYLTHRISWIITNFNPPKGYVVMHICDNPSCCNPSHLVLGTSQANNCDKIIKKRGSGPINPARGVFNTNSKLNDEKVKEIRGLYPTYNQYQLADMYGVSQANIASILKNKTWRHI